MIASGANNIKLLFSTIFIAGFSIAATTMNCGEPETGVRTNSTLALAEKSVVDDTSFIVKAIKFHQQQVMLTDIADKKLTDTGLKRVVSQIRIDHQAALGELFKLYKSSGADRSEKSLNDSLIADRTNDLSNEQEKVSDMEGNKFKSKWLAIMIREYDHYIPEFEDALDGNMNEKLRKATAAALTEMKENKKELQVAG